MRARAIGELELVRYFEFPAPEGEACACDLTGPLGRSQATVSHHLSQLTKAGILEREQRGKWAWFRLSPTRLDDICLALGGPAAC